MATLSVVNLQKHFGSVKAVDGVNFRVEDGEFLCILGPSGCGKSTVLRMIAGFEEPTGGDIRIGDSSVMNMPANRRPTAMVFQKYTLWPHMKVFDNIAFGLKLRKLPATEIKRKVEESLAMVGMAEYGERMPAQLSGGQQQRVALARALVLEPKLLLLDEPFSNLDALLRVHLREELRRIQQRTHITTIFVTHDQEEALTMADRIAVMNGGRLEQIDQPSNIYANPQTLFVADFIGVMNLVPGSQRGETITAGGLNLPSRGAFDGPVTVAVRPEDLILSGDSRPDGWSGTIEQMIDLGHYRRGLISVPAIGSDTVKVYLPKTTQFGVGDKVSLSPSRYLVYRDGQAPVEMHTQSSETMASISRP